MCLMQIVQIVCTRCAASDLGLNYLSLSQLWDINLRLVGYKRKKKVWLNTATLHTLLKVSLSLVVIGTRGEKAP